MPLDKIAGAALSTLGSDVLNARGNSRDMRNQERMFDYRIDQGLSYGLTPYEMFMGPAGGAGGGTTGSGAVLGNAAAQQGAQLQAMQQESEQRDKDRETQITMNANTNQTQKEIAKIKAGVDTAGQQNQREIADNLLALQTRQLEEIELPKAAEALNLTRAQVEKALNEAITSSPKWQLALKQLSMGPDNMWVQAYIEHKGINPITDPDSFKKMSFEKRRDFLLGFLVYKSKLVQEGAGLSSILGNQPESEKTGIPHMGAQNPDRETIWSSPFFRISKDKQ